MSISRRSFIKTAASALVFPTVYPISQSYAQADGGWKTYEVRTEITIDAFNPGYRLF